MLQKKKQEWNIGIKNVSWKIISEIEAYQKIWLKYELIVIQLETLKKTKHKK